MKDCLNSKKEVKEMLTRHDDAIKKAREADEKAKDALNVLLFNSKIVKGFAKLSAQCKELKFKWSEESKSLINPVDTQIQLELVIKQVKEEKTQKKMLEIERSADSKDPREFKLPPAAKDHTHGPPKVEDELRKLFPPIIKKYKSLEVNMVFDQIGKYQQSHRAGWLF